MLPGTSTVWEYLRFHAKLRMLGSDSHAMEQRVWSVIQLLGLSKVWGIETALVLACAT